MSEQTQVATTEQQAPKYELQRVTRQELMVRAEQAPPAQMRSFGELQMMSGHVAHAGILGTQDPAQVLTLMLMAQAEGRDCMAVKGRWWIWNQDGKIHTQRNAKSVLADFHRAGGQTQILVDTAERVTIRFLYRGWEYTCSWDDETVKVAGLTSRGTHKNYPRIMKFHRCVTEGVGKIAPEVLDGAVAVGETVIDLDEVMPPKPVIQAQSKPVEMASKSAVAKALAPHKKAWNPDGKPTLEDLAPAWAWLSVVLGVEVSGPDAVPASAVDKIGEIFAAGKEEISRRLADNEKRQADDVIDAEIEEGDAQDDEDDPFSGVSE